MNRRRRLLETNYGRKCGWWIEVEGRRIARLEDPRFEDMFWDSYRLLPLTDHPEDRRLLHCKDFWDACKAVYRNCEFDEVVPGAFASGSAEIRLRETGRLAVRGLYLDL